MSDNLLSIPCTTIKGEQKTLADFAGKAVLVVNTASQCGFTPQYKGLEALWQTYKDQGLVVLGFPCNQFGKQEPGNEGAITEFCELNFGVSFPCSRKSKSTAPTPIRCSSSLNGGPLACWGPKASSGISPSS